MCTIERWVIMRLLGNGEGVLICARTSYAACTT
ncbi:unnamed protein product [Anisakis simplex]|uniref:Uncharacterized protein n=1 Tax=Anisakis simplex TaxID=6269 RepID=A0A0M3J0T1_ANISI|nr:unnamed protein product [Anisakis simplex]